MSNIQVDIGPAVDAHMAKTYGLTSSHSVNNITAVSPASLNIQGQLVNNSGDPYLAVSKELFPYFYELIVGAKPIIEKTLIEIHQSDNVEVRRFVAMHRYTPEAVLILMQDDVDIQVREFVKTRLEAEKNGTD